MKEKQESAEKGLMEEIEETKKQVAMSPWRQQYHIQPIAGLLNDPNGLAFFGGQYHFFYQWYPFGVTHGSKYWYHICSKDMVHWQERGVALAPDQDFDLQGVYSGSAIEKNGELYLFYSGNKRDYETGERSPSICLAKMSADGVFEKNRTPVIAGPPCGYTSHFRDPKVWQAELGDYWMAVGAQTIAQQGTVLLFKSENLMDWSFEGELETPLADFGYMWECPDYFKLKNLSFLIFSPQGIEATKDGQFQNVYQSGYLKELVETEKPAFSMDAFTELDRGFDFYAPQTFEAPGKRRVLVGWMGLPEISYPTDAYGWAHCLTLPRELTVEQGRLYQRPIQELEMLRMGEYSKKQSIKEQEIYREEEESSQFEIIYRIEHNEAKKLHLKIRANQSSATYLLYEKETRRFTVNRGQAGVPFAEQFGVERSVVLDEALFEVRIFSDESSLEIFLNDGQEVFTLRIFPQGEAKTNEWWTEGGTAQLKIQKWQIKRSEENEL
ncbi:glycoside hydrolase family 32 protein [Listeria costaricensis]|uniref:glycoside hydrolase family 32 protein n=1 Tax=Listeria costaricensis TaxID=2026604 RepID=UPI0013C4AAE9|nr:sucrose-6-phosphate hydrolase [Listeria costaricensis]